MVLSSIQKYILQYLISCTLLLRICNNWWVGNQNTRIVWNSLDVRSIKFRLIEKGTKRVVSHYGQLIESFWFQINISHWSCNNKHNQLAHKYVFLSSPLLFFTITNLVCIILQCKPIGEAHFIQVKIVVLHSETRQLIDNAPLEKLHMTELAKICFSSSESLTLFIKLYSQFVDTTNADRRGFVQDDECNMSWISSSDT